MLPDPVRTILSILVPVGFVAAAELPPMAPTPAQEPQPRSRNIQLVDRVVPGYGTVHHRPARRDSRVEQLYHRIQAFAAGLDTGIMEGEVHRPARSYEIQTNEQGYPMAQASERPALPEEQQLVDLLEELAVLREEIPYPNHYEEWHFDEAWGNLQRSADALRLGLSEEAYLQLEELHAAWVTHYHQSLAKAQAEYALELVEQGQSPGSAVAQAREQVQDIPYPAMSLDGQYPALVIPPVVPKGSTATPTPAPEPVSKPDLAPAPEPEELPAAPEDAPASPGVPEAPPSAPTPEPEIPAAPLPPTATGLAAADALYDAGSEIYQQAVSAADFDQRDQLYNTAELVLTEAVERYTSALENDPENVGLSEQLRKANQLRYGSVKQARSDAQGNAKAKREAESIIEQALAQGATPSVPPVVEEELVPEDLPEPQPEPLDEQPVPENVEDDAQPAPVVEEAEPEPEPVPDPIIEEVAEEPAPMVEEAEPEPEPVVEEAEPEPMVEETEPEPAPAAEEKVDEEKVDEAVEALDDLDWPDL